MSHLSEKIAEFVLGELSNKEIAEAQLHLAACADCRTEVETFRQTHTFLKQWADTEPPRRIIFETEKRSPVWRWLVPTAAAAALIMAFVIAAPIQVRWQESQVTIAFGAAPQDSMPQSSVVAEPVAQPLDYERIIGAVRDSQEVWLANELEMREVAHLQDIRRLSGNIAYIESMQRYMYRDTIDNAKSIQLLAQSQPRE
jgi:anti-sigma factor RsiW